MKTTATINGKIRKSIESLIEEIPTGMRRYSMCITFKNGSFYSAPDCDYDRIVNSIKEYREGIVLWEVKTRKTSRTFSIEFRVNRNSLWDLM